MHACVLKSTQQYSEHGDLLVNMDDEQCHGMAWPMEVVMELLCLLSIMADGLPSGSFCATVPPRLHHVKPALGHAPGSCEDFMLLSGDNRKVPQML